MATPTSESLYEVFISLQDPRQSGKIQHGLAETLVIIVCGLLVGADTLVEIEFWAKQKQDWLQQHLRLPHGIPSHDTMGATVESDRPTRVRCRLSTLGPWSVPSVSRSGCN